jgi:hypothetical protein
VPEDEDITPLITLVRSHRASTVTEKFPLWAVVLTMVGTVMFSVAVITYIIAPFILPWW